VLLPLKPAPDPVVRALEFCAASAAEAVFVGDSEADLRAACGARVHFYDIAAHVDARTRLASAGARDVFVSPLALMFHLKIVPADGTELG
jgi:phosphoglycolate phosphatase-like HAD superfamily hydrolase